MKYLSSICLLLFVGCAQKTASDKKSILLKEDNAPIEFQFNRGLKDYMGESISITGFLFTDSIGDFLEKGNYIIFERPNCFECGQVMTEAKTDISVVKVEDSSYVNPYKGYNWRLIKISGVVNNESQLTIDRTEVSPYSYPDYENSGFVPITDDYLKHHVKDQDLVYVDGMVNPKAEGYSEEIFLLKLQKTGIATTGYAILHNGDAPNLSRQIPGQRNAVITETKDWKGDLVGNKMLRLYGVIDYDKTQPSKFTIQVEAIRIAEGK